MSPEKFLVYEYDSQGRYGKPLEVTELTLRTVFVTIVALAKKEKRKVIITDTADMCVFHMENGEIIFPKPGDIADAS